MACPLFKSLKKFQLGFIQLTGRSLAFITAPLAIFALRHASKKVILSSDPASIKDI